MNRPALILIPVLLFLTACTLGPDYRRPPAPVSSAWKDPGPWREASPRDAVPRGAWWEVFGDPVLNDLERQAMAGNPGLQVAAARVAQARAGLDFSRADQVPRVDLNGSARRSRTPGDFSPGGAGSTGSAISLPLDLGYEVDLWGRVRRSVEAAAGEAEASRSDFETARLSMQAEVARTWFALRTLDAESVLLRQATELRRENLRLVRSRFDAGETSQLDVRRAETELATAEAETAVVARERIARVNALAVLVGRSASEFDLPSRPLDLAAPEIAPTLPASLLERRPDVAAAERRMAAANARIGVAETAFFPALRLLGSAGYGSASLGDLFAWDNRTWGLGPSLSLPVFEGGRNRANLQRAEAVWNEAAATYRQQVLTAMREVEDGLSGLRLLEEQSGFQYRAVSAADEAAELSRKRYRAGMVSYLEVVDAERTVLQAERQAARILGQRLETTVLLVKALGGGWDEPLPGARGRG